MNNYSMTLTEMIYTGTGYFFAIFFICLLYEKMI